MIAVEDHLGLVQYFATKLVRRLPRHIEREDLISAGYVGLCEAALRYDEARGSFATFARRRIVGAMLDELRSHDLLPRRERAKRRHELTVVQLEPSHDTAVTTEPDRLVLAREATDAVLQLEPKRRAVITGLFLREEPYAQVQAALGMSESNIALLRREALRTLQSRLAA